MPQFAIAAQWVYLLHALIFAAGWMLLRSPRLDKTGARVRLVMVLACCGLAAAVTFVLGEPKWPLEDFQDAYYVAGAAVVDDPQSLLSSTAHGVHGFVNLPIVAYLFAPFAVFEAKIAAVIFTLLGAGTIALVWIWLTRLAQLPAQSSFVLLFVMAAFGPLHNSLKEGNTSHMALLAVVGALLLLNKRRDFAAGVVLGLTALVKLPLLLFGVYLLLRRRWGAVAGGATAIALAVLASIAIFGWQAHVSWYRMFVGSAAESMVLAFNVQSIQAFIGRLELGSAVLENWNSQSVSAATRSLGTAAALLLYAVAVGVCLLRPMRSGDAQAQQQATLIESGVVVTLACLTSPLSWSHYYTWLLLPIALSMREGGWLAPGNPPRPIALLALWLVAAPVLVLPATVPGFDSWYARFGVSHLLVGALVMLGAALSQRTRLFEAAPAALASGTRPGA